MTTSFGLNYEMHDAVIKGLFAILSFYLTFHSEILLSKGNTSKCCTVYEYLFMIRSSLQCELNSASFQHANTQCPGIICALNRYGSNLNVFIY